MFIDYHAWVSLSSALLTPTIAITGIYIAYRQWKTNDLKRQNDLFDRRYEFYIRFRNWWLSVGQHAYNESERPYICFRRYRIYHSTSEINWPTCYRKKH